MFATDYRPQRFSEVVGQDLAKATLKSLALCDGVKARAVLLQGAWGSGKSTLARIFAKAMNCENFRKGDADGVHDVCCDCPACRDVSSGSSFLYREYDATRVGNVEGVKSLVDALQIRNFEGRRVVCIDECHACSVQAQSTLLKVLEEGIPDTVFVFCTTGEVLKTIKSRSLFLEISTLSPQQIIGRCREVAAREGVELSDEQYAALALKSQGHMRDALSILEHFSISGDEALRTPLVSFRKFVLCCLRRQSVDEPLMDILQFPLQDIKSCIDYFIKRSFVAQEGLEGKIRSKGLSYRIFRFFYAPESQQALRDEFGAEILLRAFAEMWRG